MRPSAFANGNTNIPCMKGVFRLTSMRPSAFANGNYIGSFRPAVDSGHFNEAVGFRQRKCRDRLPCLG